MAYAFTSTDTLTFATAIARVAQDPELSLSRRRIITSRLRQIVRWCQQSNPMAPLLAASLPFDPSHVEALAKKLNPATLTKKAPKTVKGHASSRPISTKSFNNAVSDARFVLRRYWFGPRWSWQEVPDCWKALAALITCRFERTGSKRLFAFFTASGMAPGAVSQDAVEPFISAVEGDPRVGDPQLHCRRALRIWNKLVKRHREVWPQVRLRMPWRRVAWAKPWAYFPPALEKLIDAFLAPPDVRGIVFGRRRSPKLRPSTIRTQKEALRWVVSVLERDGVNREELNNLRSLCTPDRFERAIELLAERAGGVTYSVEKCARVLLKIAKHAEVLDPAEIAAVKASYQEVALDFTTWKDEQVDRDQEALNNLDDSRLVDALLRLPTCTLNRVLTSKRKTRGAAYAVQRALILSLWFCAPLRAGNMLGLRLDSFSRITVDGADWVALSVPGREVKNREALEHFLDEETADLLDLYLRDYRPLIAPAESPWLFPGPNGQPKSYQTLRIQMRNYLTRGIKLENFHPHLIRKIVVKIIFDLDPNAREVARRSGGWKSDATMQKAYMQRRQRGAQARYLKMLEERRLQSFRPLSPRNRKA